MSAGTDLRVRVTVSDVWDTVTLALSSDVSLRDLKARALAQALGRDTDAAGYVLKFRGAPVLDEDRSIGDLEAPDGAAFIVLSDRRRPVR